MGKHETQRSPVELAADELNFMQHIFPKVSEQNCDPKFIINMDQTPIFFTCHSKKILKWKGTKSVHILTSRNDTKRATLAVFVFADRSNLPPILIFKGTQNGQIAKKELSNFPPGCKYFCQENGWMDERVMIEWIENIFKPFIETALENVVPLPVLDSYQCDMMTSVVETIQQLGVEVEHIPGGCTSLCQPVDVGINKAMKMLVHNDWEDWMLDSGINVLVV